MRLSRLILNCQSPDNLAKFYAAHLSMTARRDGESWIVGYGGIGSEIELRPVRKAGAYVHSQDDRYWKIGISVPDLCLAHSTLRADGIEVSDPHMFENIGFMSHLEDPEGFKIELLQQTFEGRPKQLGYLLSSEVFTGIGQITLRTSDIEKALGFYRDQLGMTLLSVQPVPKYKFTLYFLAFTDERPPSDDLEAVSNREWLWQRPYTTLELQAFDAPRNAFGLPGDGAPGFAALIAQSKGSDPIEIS